VLVACSFHFISKDAEFIGQDAGETEFKASLDYIAKR
jgi:hypothetical protein